MPTTALDPYLEEGSVTYINRISVDIEKSKEITVEVFPFGNASSDSAHLIAAITNIEIPKQLSRDQSLDFLWRAVQEDSDLVIEADPYALLALDVRGLDRSAVNLLSLLYGEAGMKDAARDELQLRYERGLDPGVENRQQRLFTPNQAGLNDVRLAREVTGWEDLADLP